MVVINSVVISDSSDYDTRFARFISDSSGILRTKRPFPKLLSFLAFFVDAFELLHCIICNCHLFS